MKCLNQILQCFQFVGRGLGNKKLSWGSKQWSKYPAKKNNRYIYIYKNKSINTCYKYIYTWNLNDPCFGWKRPCFGGLTFKNRGHLGSRYIIYYQHLSTLLNASQQIFKRVVHKSPFGLNTVFKNCNGLFWARCTCKPTKKKKT